jgi:2-polyprenyl-3-methyl-5-hydroxy-6-metoxy-1,4-benzoquinol methylase
MTEAKVKNMYTDFVYPAYDEMLDEKAPELIQTRQNNLKFFSHYFYKGRKTNFDNFKILFAGAGLGSCLIHLALLLKKYKNIKITAIDLSPSSLEILRKRLDIYKIEGVEIIEMSLLDLDPEKVGKFDMINCVGVLHHLENPSLGLRALKNVLEDDGFMEVMVYGKIGRTGIYQMQDLLKMANKEVEELDYSTKLENYKKIYPFLQQNNWFKKSEMLGPDHLTMGDNGVIDLLLHHQDRAYTIPELYHWVEGEDLNIVEFMTCTRFKLKKNIEGIEFKTEKEKYAFNELFFGDLIKHSFYISKNNDTVAEIDDLNNIMILNNLIQPEWDNLMKKLEELGHCYPNPELNFNFNYYTFNNTEVLLKTPHQGNVRFKSDFVTNYILKNIDGIKKTKRLFTNLREDLKLDITNEELLERFRPVYDAFNMHDVLLLKRDDRILSFN